MTIDNIVQAFSNGNLEKALSLASDLIKHNSSNTELRLLFVELLCYDHQWKRADQNLILLSRLVPEREPFFSKWRQNIRAAMDREAVFSFNASPVLLHEITPGIERALHTLKALKSSKPIESEYTPYVSMQVNQSYHGEVRDADELLGGILEIYSQDGKYCWVDMMNIQALVLLPSKQKIDQLWCPASLTLLQKKPFEIWLPMIYPTLGSEACRAGIETKWIIENGIKRGQGLKTWFVGEQQLPLNKCKEFIGSRHY